MPRSIWFLDTLVRIHSDGEQTGDRSALLESIAPSGHQPPPHVHHHEDETFFVLEGELTVHTPTDAIVVGPGESAFAVRGVPHTFAVTSPGAARFLVTSTPAGFERFVEAFGTPAERDALPVLDGPPDAERLARVAAEHGIDLLGPPGMLPADLALGASSA